MMDAGMSRRSFLHMVPGGLVLAAGLMGTVGVAVVGAAPVMAAGPRSIGTLTVPKLKLSRTIYEGIANDALDIGVGYGMWSARPGQSGHCMVFGHRTTHGGPFRGLNKLAKGDKIMAGGVTYAVRKIEVFSAAQRERIWTYDGGGQRLSLVACSTATGAPTSLKYRICVRASA